MNNVLFTGDSSENIDHVIKASILQKGLPVSFCHEYTVAMRRYRRLKSRDLSFNILARASWCYVYMYVCIWRPSAIDHRQPSMDRWYLTKKADSVYIYIYISNNGHNSVPLILCIYVNGKTTKQFEYYYTPALPWEWGADGEGGRGGWYTSFTLSVCMLWVCSYWKTSVRAWNSHARWGFLEHLPMVF